jgi:hypothetical protein
LRLRIGVPPRNKLATMPAQLFRHQYTLQLVEAKVKLGKIFADTLPIVHASNFIQRARNLRPIGR